MISNLKKIYLIPVYNEQDHLEKLIYDMMKIISDKDLIVFVDDASEDNSLNILKKNKTRSMKILSLKKNTGLGGALKKGFRFINKLDFEGPVITIDGDYQHDLSKLDKFITYYKSEKLDFLLIGRVMGDYPLYKRIGNRLFSIWTSFITGRRFYDVETGFRIMDKKMLKEIEPYYKGIKYSCAQELAVICSLRGYKIDNTLKTRLRHYRTNTSFKDAFLNFIVSIVTFLKVFNF